MNILDKSVYWYLDNIPESLRIGITAAGDSSTLLSSMVLASKDIPGIMPWGRTKKVADVMNAIFEVMSLPNIEGIPIHAESESVSRDTDVSETMIIAQNDNGKDWLTDNAVPRPREWQINGYLSSISGVLDAYFAIKPTIVLQAELLDIYAKSRRPVWFKTHDNRFYRVLISRIQTSYDPTFQNAIKVQLTLREFIPLRTSLYSATAEEMPAMSAEDTGLTTMTEVTNGTVSG